MGIKGLVDKNFWQGKKVFLTGHTGFKGSWCSLWLQQMGAEVKGYSLEPKTKPNLFSVARVSENMISEIGDIRDLGKISKSIQNFGPDILIHMAAQPLVRYSYKNPVETFETNVMGTVNVLEAAKNCQRLKAIVSVTTDKCYENKEWAWGYRENEAMGGHDPYSSSKGCAELVTSAYRRSFFCKNISANLASARAGNVIGGGDWSEDRLIPDVLRAFEKDQPVVIRNPLSTRPWQHVLEPVSGYLVLAQALFKNENNKFAEGWNFGPKDEDCRTVNWILDTMIHEWGGQASWILDDNSNPHEASFLKLDISKANQKLGWKPRWDLKKSLSKVVNWHKHFINGGDMKKYSLREIDSYYSDEI